MKFWAQTLERSLYIYIIIQSSIGPSANKWSFQQQEHNEVKRLVEQWNAHWDQHVQQLEVNAAYEVEGLHQLEDDVNIYGSDVAFIHPVVTFLVLREQLSYIIIQSSLVPLQINEVCFQQQEHNEVKRLVEQ